MPAVVDGALERWWALPPRLRAAAALAALLLVAGSGVLRVARSPYGPPVAVVVAERDLAVGDPAAGAVAAERRPLTLVPRDAVVELPDEATLAMGVVAGTVLTARHLRPGGPHADQPAGSTAVAVPAAPVPGARRGWRRRRRTPRYPRFSRAPSGRRRTWCASSSRRWRPTMSLGSTTAFRRPTSSVRTPGRWRCRG
ncbi:MAG: SAF domain-containing protein, partial [Nitriliruptoraceae bacterium]